MDTALRVLGILPRIDWVALVFFCTAWAGYAIFARHHGRRDSLLDTTNRVRRQWMLQTTYREPRVVDGMIIQNLSTSPSFFASTTILIIGGLLAVFGAADKAHDIAGRIVGMAAETVNDGLRAYYFSFAVAGWFFSPYVFLVASAGVVWILYQREFHSDVLAVLSS